jgi:hypothetical protein
MIVIVGSVDQFVNGSAKGRRKSTSKHSSPTSIGQIDKGVVLTDEGLEFKCPMPKSCTQEKVRGKQTMRLIFRFLDFS